MEGKLLPQLTFNPELALTGFRTTQPWGVVSLIQSLSPFNSNTTYVVVTKFTGKKRFSPFEDSCGNQNRINLILPFLKSLFMH